MSNYENEINKCLEDIKRANEFYEAGLITLQEFMIIRDRIISKIINISKVEICEGEKSCNDE